MKFQISDKIGDINPIELAVAVYIPCRVERRILRAWPQRISAISRRRITSAFEIINCVYDIDSIDRTIIVDVAGPVGAATAEGTGWIRVPKIYNRI